MVKFSYKQQVIPTQKYNQDTCQKCAKARQKLRKEDK